MKKFVSILLSVIFIFSISVTAFADYSYVAEVNGVAYNSVDTACVLASAGSTVSLLKDSTDPAGISNKQGITLDLNGHTMGTLTIDGNSSVTIKDSDNLSRGTIISTDDAEALIIENSKVDIINANITTEGDFAVAATDAQLNVYAANIKGNIIDEYSTIVVYSGLYSSAQVAQYMYPQCQFVVNPNPETAEAYPFAIQLPGGSERDDIHSLPIIGPILSDDESGYRCPACDIFDGIYSGQYGTLVTNVKIVYSIFDLVHKMIHVTFKLVNWVVPAETEGSNISDLINQFTTQPTSEDSSNKTTSENTDNTEASTTIPENEAA